MTEICKGVSLYRYGDLPPVGYARTWRKPATRTHAFLIHARDVVEASSLTWLGVNNSLVLRRVVRVHWLAPHGRHPQPSGSKGFQLFITNCALDMQSGVGK